MQSHFISCYELFATAAQKNRVPTPEAIAKLIELNSVNGQTVRNDFKECFLDVWLIAFFSLSRSGFSE